MILRWRVEGGEEEAELEGAGSSFISTSWVMLKKLYQKFKIKKLKKKFVTNFFFLKFWEYEREKDSGLEWDFEKKNRP